METEETPLHQRSDSYGLSDSSEEISKISEAEYLDPSIAALPENVREIVSFEDDPTTPVFTFRYFVLATVFIIPGAFIDTINSFRTTSAAYSIFFVQIAAHWTGHWMARVLPRRRVGFGVFSFSLNPGPYSIKETALITITAKSGATGNLATNALALVELYFDVKVPPLAAMLFMWAIVFTGYSFAAIARRVVSYDPHFTWPQSLMQTALLRSQDKASSSTLTSSSTSTMKVFIYCVAGLAIWQMLPEFLFPMTSSVAVLCYMAPTSHAVNFIGLGLGGMGFMNLLFDWANITSLVMLYPYWVQVVQFVAFVCGAWVMLPLAKWTLLVNFKYGLMLMGLFQSNGQPYPASQLITSLLTLNETAYAHYGPVHLGAQRAWNMFFDYAAYASGIAWVLIFGWSKLRKSFQREAVFNDKLSIMHRQYRDVPDLFYGLLFLASLASFWYVHSSGYLFVPWWAVIIALCVGSIIVTPLMWMYALLNFQLPIGTFNELLFGSLIQNAEAKHPAGAAFFGCIAGNAWYRSQYHLEAMKLGFYNHIPPMAVFFAQLFGEFIGVPINYASLRWVLATKRRYLTGELVDPLHQWTAQGVTVLHTNAIQYVILGPRRLFNQYPWLPYGFLLGLVGPLIIFSLYKRFPGTSLHFDLWNTTVFFSTMSHFYGNISTGYLSKFLGGTGAMFYAYRYKHALWTKYNYIAAAGLDTGYNVANSIIFGLFSFGITAPIWWGNNPTSVERCFAL